MKNNASLTYNFFLVIGDAFALVCAFVSAYILRVSILSSHRALEYPVHSRTYLNVFLVLLPFWILVFALIGLYNSSIYEKRFNEIGRLLVGSFIGMLFVVFWNFLAAKPILPARSVPIIGFVLAFTFLVVFRTLARFMRTLLFRYNVGITKVLIVGDTRVTQELVDLLGDSRLSGYKIMGVVGNAEKLDLPKNLKIYPDFASANKHIGANKLHGIIQTQLYSDADKNDEILNYAQSNHIAYRFTPGNAELFVGNITVDLFRASIPVIAVHQTALLGWGRVVKRLFDIFVSGIFLILLSPLMVIIGLLNLLINHGLFFRQTRLTRFNQKFRVFKFQTVRGKYNNMTPEEAFTKMGKPELIKIYRENGDQLHNDPRYGKFSRFLRATTLDELPQLFNVFRGDISLVGPRSLIPQELELYTKRHTILSVKSGLTGLAQVSGRKHISFDERRQLDMFYVQNWSFGLDLIILVKTIRVIFSGS